MFAGRDRHTDTNVTILLSNTGDGIIKHSQRSYKTVAAVAAEAALPLSIVSGVPEIKSDWRRLVVSVEGATSTNTPLDVEQVTTVL